MKQKQVGILTILVIAVTAASLGTTSLSLTSPVFASGDEKICRHNGDNNCNDTYKTQEIKLKNDCVIVNTNKDHSSDNFNNNTLACVNEAQNLKDSVQLFGETDGLGADSEESADSEEQATVTEEPAE